MPFGYNGRILRVNLSKGEMRTEEPGEYFYRTYGGGSCLGVYYLLKEMDPGVDPLSPENIIVFAGSAVSGAPAPGFARSCIVSKSPLTGSIANTVSGGYFGPEMKFAGFDAIVIKGKSEKPVYLWVHDGEADIKDASHIWGKTTGETQGTIRKELGDGRIIVAGIGQAGENLVRYACVVNNLKHAWGRCGTGAVMGSKNLKAIAARGHNKPKMKDRETVLSIARHFATNFMKESVDNITLHDFGTAGDIMPQNETGQLPTRNFQTGYFDKAENISGERMKDTVLVKGTPCYACPVSCKKVVKADTPYQVDPAYGGPEYETIAMMGSDCGVSDLVAICKGNELCNKYGLDTISTGASIAFAMECYEEGIITREDTGGVDLRFGNADAMVKTVEMIAKREKIGDMLAEGVRRAAEKLGEQAEKFALHVKGGEIPGHDPRVKGHLTLMYALAPQGASHIQAEHDPAFAPGWAPFFSERANPLGILEPLEVSSIDHKKVRRFFYLQSAQNALNTLAVCTFALAPVRYLTFRELVDLVRAITGWETSLWELQKLGERTIAMLRAFSVREGFTKEDDWLPERMFEGILSGPCKGQKVNKDKLREAIDLYYEMAGWNKDGVPTKGKLAELDVSWVAEELEKRGKYRK